MRQRELERDREREREKEKRYFRSRPTTFRSDDWGAGRWVGGGRKGVGVSLHCT